MRIVAGSAKGRRLVAPKHGTRPFTGRAREAVFSMLGDRVVGARVLDLYAGTGSLGLEAASRGAAEVVHVETFRPALAALRRNVENVGLDTRVVAERVETFLERTSGPWDIAFVDPPYELAAEELADVLRALGAVLATAAVVVVHRRTGTPLLTGTPTILSIRDVRRYGDAEIWWLEKETR
jgi:16S rRNA (guanine966-N2)-methyltransferase